MVTDAGSYSRLIDSCTTQLKAEGPSRTCTESKEEEQAPAVEAGPACAAAPPELGGNVITFTPRNALTVIAWMHVDF